MGVDANKWWVCGGVGGGIVGRRTDDIETSQVSHCSTKDLTDHSFMFRGCLYLSMIFVYSSSVQIAVKVFNRHFCSVMQ